MDETIFIRELLDRARGAGFEGCEACFARGESFDVTVFGGRVIDYSVSSSTGLGFRALVDGKMGYAATQAFDEQAIDLLIEGARDNARLIESEDRQFLFAGAETPAFEVYNPALDELSIPQRLQMALDLEKKTLAVDPRVKQVEGCGFFLSSGERRIVNSAGLNAHFRDNAVGLSVSAVAREGERASTGGEYFLGRSLDGLSLDGLAQAAVREAVLGLEGAPVASGKYRVVLKNEAAAALLATFAGVFSADNAQKGLSLLKGREGQTIAAEVLTLLDDPLNPAGLCAQPFDGEGVPCRRKAVIEGGRLNALLHNLKTAHKQGVASTGNASRPSYAASVGVAPTNFYFEPTDLPLEELLVRAGDGLLITDLQGLHAGANGISGDFSLGAKGRLIEGGRLGRAVDQITVAGNFFDLLKGVRAVGKDLRFGFPGACCVGSPSLYAGELTVAGQ